MTSTFTFSEDNESIYFREKMLALVYRNLVGTKNMFIIMLFKLKLSKETQS